MTDGKVDEIKGRIKEAAGDLMDDRKMKDEGRIDKASGKVKQTVEKGVDKVKDAFKK